MATNPVFSPKFSITNLVGLGSWVCTLPGNPTRGDNHRVLGITLPWNPTRGDNHGVLGTTLPWNPKGRKLCCWKSGENVVHLGLHARWTNTPTIGLDCQDEAFHKYHNSNKSFAIGWHAYIWYKNKTNYYSHGKLGTWHALFCQLHCWNVYLQFTLQVMGWLAYFSSWLLKLPLSNKRLNTCLLS